MPKKTNNKKLIENFFLGNMPEDERFEFEERFVADAEFFDEVKAFEDDLIENYVRGWLDPQQRSTFEKRFLTTKKRRENVEFARVFIDKLSGLSGRSQVVELRNAVADRESGWQKIIAYLFSPKFALTAAALVVAGAFGSWVLYQNFISKQVEIVKNPGTVTTENKDSTSIPDPKASPGQISADNEAGKVDPADDSTDKLNDSPPERDEKPDINRQKAGKGPKTEKTPSRINRPKTPQLPQNPVIALFPGLVRSNGKINEIRLPANAKGAAINLNLESADYETYSARLANAEGNVVFFRSGLKAAKSKLNLFVPAKNLKPGDYMIKLYGKNNAGDEESVADFQFRVQE
ncbi:MAG: hypothetical protein KDB79_07350 [Acidobacteria bacterium]|nr:hypothetical protein [Acidobacteriota bacterium]